VPTAVARPPQDAGLLVLRFKAATGTAGQVRRRLGGMVERSAGLGGMVEQEGKVVEARAVAREGG
jgi:hypothetical protein